MAFPQIASKTFTKGASSSLTVNLPATINAGDLLICLVGVNNLVTDSSPTDSTSDAWTDIDLTGASGGIRGGAYYKIADGDEDSGTLSITWTGGSSRSCAVILRITDWKGSGAPESSNWGSGTSTTPNSGSVTPSWGAADTLWLTAFMHNNPLTGPTAPTNYDAYGSQGVDWEQEGSDANGANIAVTQRELNATSEDPGNHSIAGASSTWWAITIAVEPAAASTASPTGRGHARATRRSMGRAAA